MLEVPVFTDDFAGVFCGVGASGNSAEDVVTPKSGGTATTTSNKIPAEHERRKIHSRASLNTLSFRRYRMRFVITRLHQFSFWLRLQCAKNSPSVASQPISIKQVALIASHPGISKVNAHSRRKPSDRFRNTVALGL
jgi:hypothetical protein